MKPNYYGSLIITFLFAIIVGCNKSNNDPLDTDTGLGTISSIECSNQVNNGEINIGVAATSVTTTLHYTGGNGGTYGALQIPSTQIDGLTATLNAGNFANGEGDLNFTISGTANALGIALFSVNIGGQSCTISRLVIGGGSPSTCGASNVLNPSINYDSVSDSEGNSYKTVTIGTQTWMAENLTTSHFSNGDLIPNIVDENEWLATTTSAWVYYNNDPSYECPHGKLYNWYVASDSRNVCPAGWRVPTSADWQVLNSYYTPLGYAGIHLKSVGYQYWKYSSSSFLADNSSGFSALPSGVRFGTMVSVPALSGKFDRITEQAHFWASDEAAQTLGWSNIGLKYDISSSMYITGFVKESALPIRCIKN